MTTTPGGFDGELVVDNFAGGGGASVGVQAALGRPVDIAINHDPVAIAMHRANHPETRHYLEDVWQVDPREACGGRPVGLAWFSPDCRHHSRARRAKPRNAGIRGLAWVAIRWAAAVSPRVIGLENVSEWLRWGPLDDNNRPVKEREGETFRRWLGRLADLGYRAEWRVLSAADYGVPTVRKRVFLIARRDDRPIVWPDKSGAPRPAASVVDWDLPCKSLFDPSRRPLVAPTMRRVALGIERYVMASKRPFVEREAAFIVRTGHYSKITGAGLRRGCGAGLFRGQSLTQPLGTVCATNDKNLVICRVRSVGGTDHSAATRRFLLDHGLATEVVVDGELAPIVDIGMRMLQPAELFAAQGFPADYVIRPSVDGKPISKKHQIRLAGNAVPPPMVEKLVQANAA